MYAWVVDEGSARLRTRGQFARGSVLEAFDDGLRRVSTGEISVGSGCTVFPEPLCPTISVSGGMNLGRQRYQERVPYSRTSVFSCPKERMPKMASLLIVAILTVRCRGAVAVG